MNLLEAPGFSSITHVHFSVHHLNTYRQLSPIDQISKRPGLDSCWEMSLCRGPCFPGSTVHEATVGVCGEAGALFLTACAPRNSCYAPENP